MRGTTPVPTFFRHAKRLKSVQQNLWRIFPCVETTLPVIAKVSGDGKLLTPSTQTGSRNVARIIRVADHHI